MPTPAEAARILRAHFGMPPDTTPGLAGTGETDPLEGVDDPHVAGDPTGAVQLGVLRGSQERDLLERIANEETAVIRPSVGYVPGEPGREYVSHPLANKLLGDRTRLEQLQGQIANDPFTGTAAQARTGKVQSALDDAATTVRPEVGAAERTKAERNAFAEYMKSKGLKMGEYEAGASPASYASGLTPIRVAGSAESQDVLDAASRRQIALERAKAQAKGTKFTAQEQALVDKAAEVQELGPKLMALMEADMPGIDKDPTKYGSWLDKASASLGGKIYRLGKTATPSADVIRQYTGYLEAAIPRMLASGRLNQQQYEDLKLHAPQVGFSDGANYERIRTILNDILPAVLRGVEEGHGETPTAITTPVDERSVPPTADDYALGATMTDADMWKRANELIKQPR